ncbi:MAG: hypothetical protein STSR0009_22800 [Methanoregula sp.]|jgi:hypothetical protein
MIVVECYADEHLLIALGIPKTNITHRKGKSRVIFWVNHLGMGIGIVDKDPDSKPPSGFSREYLQICEEGSLALLQHRHYPNRRIIEIQPRLEEWILARARVNHIHPSDYSLPNDGEALHNDPHYERRANYQLFLGTLVQIDAEMRTMKRWIDGTSP